MNRKKISQVNSKKKSSNRKSPIPWRYCVLTLICGLILVTGFFFAARQHFSSIDYSIKNSRMRRQLDELEAGKRRLLLAKEIALSPAEIKKVAKKIGFVEASDNISAIPAKITAAVKPNVEKLKEAVAAKVETIKNAAENSVKEKIKGDKTTAAANVRPEKPPVSVK